MRVVNLKEDMPNADYAVFRMLQELDWARREGISVLLFIHGHGSRGVKSVIKQRVTEELFKLKKEKKIQQFIPGELWGLDSPNRETLCKAAPELIVYNVNAGNTIVLV